MVHTYEVLVDIKECSAQPNGSSHISTSRYEIDAESKAGADCGARSQAKIDHPDATEYDARVTRLLV